MFYWIKLKTDFFYRPEIDYILSNEIDGCKYIILYQMLCLNTANSNGVLIEQINDLIIPYDINKIVRDTKYFDKETVTSALKLYIKLGLIYIQENSYYVISDFEDMVGAETKWAVKKRNTRNKQKGQCPTEEEGQTSGHLEDIVLNIKNIEKENRTFEGQMSGQFGDNVHTNGGNMLNECKEIMDFNSKGGQMSGHLGDNVLQENRDKRLENRYKSIDNRDIYKYNNFKNKEILPYWMEHPEVCEAVPTTEEDRRELEELLKEFKK